MTFEDPVSDVLEDDVTPESEKVAASEAHSSVLRLLYQLCPQAAPFTPLASRKVCDFEGLFPLGNKPSTAEGAPSFFHRVAELLLDQKERFRLAAETGKSASSALPSAKRMRAFCSNPVTVSSAVGMGKIRYFWIRIRIRFLFKPYNMVC